MHKKTVSIVSLLLIVIVMFTGCAKGPVRNVKAPEKTPVVLPDSLIPSVEMDYFEYDDDNKSSAYYQAEMSTTDVKEFYEKAFKDMGVYDIKELDEKALLEKNIIPEPSEDSLGDVVWVYYGRYKLSLPEIPSKTPGQTNGTEPVEPEPGHIIVICTESEGKVGVEVGIAYRAYNMAVQFGFIETATTK